MRVLVGGAAGFLGSHLCDALLAQGHYVHGVDNFLTGNEENLTSAKENPRFTFSRYRLGKLTYGIVGKVFDAIFHLASPASPDAYWRHPLETLEANSLGTQELIDCALVHNAVLLYTSSSEVYGNATVIPCSEDYWGNVNPIGVRAMYDESKRFSEALISTCVKSFSLRAVIVRLFNTYGGRLRPDDGRVVPTFIRQALNNEPLTVHAPGTQTRSLCYVDDTIAGIVKAAFLGEKKGEPAVYNIGNPDEVSMLDLAHTVLVVARRKKRGRVHIVEGRQEEIARRVPDITRARETFGWEPKVGLEEGLRKTVDWYRGRSR